MDKVTADTRGRLFGKLDVQVVRALLSKQAKPPGIESIGASFVEDLKAEIQGVQITNPSGAHDVHSPPSSSASQSAIGDVKSYTVVGSVVIADHSPMLKEAGFDVGCEVVSKKTAGRFVLKELRGDTVVLKSDSESLDVDIGKLVREWAVCREEFL
jgi:hypothetical protein